MVLAYGLGSEAYVAILAAWYGILLCGTLYIDYSVPRRLTSEATPLLAQCASKAFRSASVTQRIRIDSRYRKVTAIYNTFVSPQIRNKCLGFDIHCCAYSHPPRWPAAASFGAIRQPTAVGTPTCLVPIPKQPAKASRRCKMSSSSAGSTVLLSTVRNSSRSSVVKAVTNKLCNAGCRQ